MNPLPPAGQYSCILSGSIRAIAIPLEGGTAMSHLFTPFTLAGLLSGTGSSFLPCANIQAGTGCRESGTWCIWEAVPSAVADWYWSQRERSPPREESARTTAPSAGRPASPPALSASSPNRSRPSRSLPPSCRPVFLARALLRDPYWPLHAARSLGVEIPWPVQYEHAKL